MEKGRKKVIVIGAGLGGLSAAISLACENYEVLVYEKNEKVGGKLNVLEKEGFSFDLGPSIFTLPKFFEELFTKAGKRMKDYFELVSVSPHWRNFFEDGTVVDLYKDPQLMKKEIFKLGGNSDEIYKKFLEFLDYSKKQYEIVDNGYFSHGLDNLWDFLKYYGIFRLGTQIDFRKRMAESIRGYLGNKYLQYIFEYFIKYVGSSAYNAPGFMNLMPNIQFEYDLWYVKGGMCNLAKGLEKLAGEVGVKIHTHKEVTKIIKDGKRVEGIILKTGEKINSDYVVSNMEVIPAYEKLLSESPSFMKKLSKFEPTCSGFVLHLGLKKVYPQLAHHNFFFSENQKKHFETVFDEKKLPDDPTIYLVAPTRTDKSQAPDGCDNIKILPHIPYINEQNPYTLEDYRAFGERVVDKLERMGLKGLRENTIVSDMWTPFDIQKRYYSNRGSIYGVVSDWKRNYGFKAPKQSRKYKNLYFTGGSVNPGGGMPMVVLCGQNVCKKIVSEK